MNWKSFDDWFMLIFVVAIVSYAVTAVFWLVALRDWLDVIRL
jgi:hypothetical protein